MREIVLDTETTGLDPKDGHRIVEIGCLELVDRVWTGATYHQYINPERIMDEGAFKVHGISDDFLLDKPRFHEISEELNAFFEGATLIAHNASFDIGFINAEFDRVKLPAIGRERILDTLALARRRHPMGPNSLDALCRRYGVDNSRREKHGALLDAELLAEVYIEMIGGRQTALGLEVGVGTDAIAGAMAVEGEICRPRPLPSRLSEAERAAHEAMIEALGENALWRAVAS